MPTLRQIRSKIDALDQRTARLLAGRLTLVRQVGEIKRLSRTKVYDPRREREVLARLDALPAARAFRPELRAIFREIMRVCRNHEQRALRPVRAKSRKS